MSTLTWMTVKELEREMKKQRRRISLEEKHESFYTVAVRNASDHQGENERQ